MGNPCLTPAALLTYSVACLSAPCLHSLCVRACVVWSCACSCIFVCKCDACSVLFDNQEKINPESLLILIHYFRQQVGSVFTVLTIVLSVLQSHMFRSPGTLNYGISLPNGLSCRTNLIFRSYVFRIKMQISLPRSSRIVLCTSVPVVEEPQWLLWG